MDPPTKRRRLVQQEHSHIDLSDRACRLSPTHRQLGNSFEGGYGVQNSGHLEFGRDFIINVNQQSSTNTDHDRYQVLLDSLRFEHMDERRLGVQKAHAHTCRWFLNSPEYVSWAEAHVSPQNDFLWIKGKPGAGKSTIMKFLLDQIRHQVRNSPNREILISFFFNARGHDLERTTLGLYRSLLFQLLESHPEILPVMNFVRIGHSWTVDSLQAVLHDAIHGLGDDSVCFLIDALDECPITQVRDMVQFFSSLTRDAGRVRTCFASRHYPHITIPTSLSVILETQGGHSNDIVDYLDQRLHIGRGDLQEQIRQGLKEKASGVFMWVVLVVDILNSEYDAGNIHILQKRAQQLPGNLHDLFLDILTRDGQPTEANLLCIQWVLFTQQPLTPRQLYFAILSGAEPDQLMTCHSADVSEGDVDRYILHNSMGLAESTRSKNPTIQFIHESVRDFLLKNEGISRIWPRLSENLLGQSHEALKKCCLTYINMEGLTNDDAAPSEASLSSYPFLEMASHGVLYHAERAQTLGIDQQGFMAVFPRSLWIKHHNMFEQYKVRRYTPEASLLYILAEAGMPALIAAHVERQSCFRVENERYGLPILAASAIKSDDTVEAMLQLQAERLPGLSFTEFYSNLPSGLDSSFGPGRNFIFKRDKALFHQLVAHGNEKSSLFFLNTEECDIHQKDNQGRTALMCAMQRGFDYLVVSLLQKGAEIPIKAENRETPLLWSLSNRHFKIARLLLESSCDISTTNKDGQTPLHCSILNRDTDIAKLLIERGSNVSAVNRVGDTPLHEASRNRFIDIVNLLIGRGCDVSAVNKVGDTPLHEASKNGFIEIVDLLIDRGCDVSPADANGNTPLHQALTRRHMSTAELLIERGSNISAINTAGDIPLHQALRNGYIDIARLLIQRGSNISATDRCGRTPLHHALDNRYIHIAKLLIEQGSDLSAVSSWGGTPLHRALKQGYIDIAKLLIERGCNTSETDEEGTTPLHMAVVMGDIAIVKLLIDHGSDVSAATKKGRTALHIAVSPAARWPGNEVNDAVIVKLLIESGCDVSAVADDGLTAAGLACKLGYRHLVKLLQQ